METKSPATNRTDAKTLLQLGQRALAQLDIQARAAQIEAQRAELEFILEQARFGDVEALQEWFRVHGKSVDAANKAGTISDDCNGSQDDPSSEDTCIESEVETEIEAEICSWDELRPFALSRLRQRTQGTTTTKSRSAAEDVRADIAHDHKSYIQAKSQLRSESKPNYGSQIHGKSQDRVDSHVVEDSQVELPNLSPAHHALIAAEAQSKTDATEAIIDVSSVETVTDDTSKNLLDQLDQGDTLEESEPIAQVVDGLDLQQAAVVGVAPKKPGRWRGMVVSAVFHVVVLVVLAAMTLKNPVKDGLLALVSGESSADSEIESFEISETAEMPQPEQAVEAAEPTSQPSLSEVVPGFNDSISESLSQSLSTPTSQTASKSNVLAAKAGPSKNVMSFYGAESSGNSFCFVLDGSGSMRGGPWEAARVELLRSIGSLKPTQRFYVIFFNKEVMAITEPGTTQPATKPLAATPENLAHVKRWLDTLQIMTGEPPMKAMEAALEIECDCVYYLADGEMSDSVAKKLLDMLRKKNRVNDIIDGEVVVMPIHTIAYYSDKGLEIMRRIAEENRGQFAYVPKPNKPKPSR